MKSPGDKSRASCLQGPEPCVDPKCFCAKRNPLEGRLPKLRAFVSQYADLGTPAEIDEELEALGRL